MWPGPRPISVPSGILNLARTVKGRKLGAVPLLGELGPQHNVAGAAEPYLHAKFHFDPSNRLATMHQRYRQIDGQKRSYSTGRIVLQTVAQEKLISDHLL